MTVPIANEDLLRKSAEESPRYSRNGTSGAASDPEQVAAGQVRAHERITIAKGLPELGDFTRQIVGVVGDVRAAGHNREPQPIMYIPWAQVPDVYNANLVGIAPLTWIARTRAESASPSNAIQDELRQASGGLPGAPLELIRRLRSEPSSGRRRLHSHFKTPDVADRYSRS